MLEGNEVFKEQNFDDEDYDGYKEWLEESYDERRKHDFEDLFWWKEL